MAQLTKTQINYFHAQFAALKTKVLQEIYGMMKFMLPKIDIAEEYVKLIASGQAELDVDAVMSYCHSGQYGAEDGPRLFTVFPEPESVCLYHRKQNELHDKLNRAVRDGKAFFGGEWADEWDQLVEGIMNDFVLGITQTQDVKQLIVDLREWRPKNFPPLVRDKDDSDDQTNLFG